MDEAVDRVAFDAALAANIDDRAELERFEPIAIYRPLILPATWRPEPAPGFNRLQACYIHTRAPLRVLMTCKRERDGKRWLHVSVCHRRRLPDWEDLREVKDVFVGRDRLAVQVLPPADQYVNIHHNVLHLWCCLDSDPVPDFRVGGAI